MSCTGNCCAVFNWNTPPDKLRARWEGLSEPLTQAEDALKRDDLYIADMLIPLSYDEVVARFERYDFKTDVDDDFDLRKWAESGRANTCAHWDTETKLCTAYEERPEMCRDYPYAEPCSLDCACTYRAPTEIRTKCSARRVEHAVRQASRTKPPNKEVQ